MQIHPAPATAPALHLPMTLCNVVQKLTTHYNAHNPTKQYDVHNQPNTTQLVRKKNLPNGVSKIDKITATTRPISGVRFADQHYLVPAMLGTKPTKILKHLQDTTKVKIFNVIDLTYLTGRYNVIKNPTQHTSNKVIKSVTIQDHAAVIEATVTHTSKTRFPKPNSRCCSIF